MCMSIRKSNMPKFSIKTAFVNDVGITGPMIPVWKVLMKDKGILFDGQGTRTNLFTSPFLDMNWVIGWNNSNRYNVKLSETEQHSEVIKYGIHCYLRKKDAIDVAAMVSNCAMVSDCVVVKMYVYPSDVVAKGSTFRSHTILLNGEAVHGYQDANSEYSSSSFDGLRALPTLVAMRVYLRTKDYLRGLYTDDELVELLAHYKSMCDEVASKIKPIYSCESQSRDMYWHYTKSKNINLDYINKIDHLF